MPHPPTELLAAPAFVIELEGVYGERVGVRPLFDVARVPGARLVASGAWEQPGLRAVAGCIAGPSDRFIEGIDDVLFEKATWASLTALEREVSVLTPTEVPNATPNVRQRALEGTSTREKPLRVQHLLAFQNEPRELLLCSVACEGDCGAVTLTLEGVTDPPPAPSFVMVAAFATASNPTTALGCIGVLALLVTGLLLWRRPLKP